MGKPLDIETVAPTGNHDDHGTGHTPKETTGRVGGRTTVPRLSLICATTALAGSGGARGKTTDRVGGRTTDRLSPPGIRRSEA
ncbi:hypothetical protein GCM10009555_037280 [Acrocarpospora macrocephala]|uniref:Uncharacterized protein n=1 Tax=Acrocarpospora macrocephala TaxID=150177 RepID=A0A5M3XEE7_9ACTN|nr:hypothetical protein Amac_100460 [Acrocarpospora macrocephala]